MATTSSVEIHELTTDPKSDGVSTPRHNTARFNDDVELRASRFSLIDDPYQLRSKLKSNDEIQAIQANTGRRRDACTPSYGKKKWQAKKVQGFYEKQNQNIERLLKSVDEHRREAKDVHTDNQLKYKIAVTGSFIANVILAILQVYGAVSSGSLSLFTTMADALFDPLSNITLILSNRAINRVDPRRFPSGKARIETAGNIVFCFLMSTVSAILIVMSVRELIETPSQTVNKFHLPSVIAVSVAFATKFALFLYCWPMKDIYSQVYILWEDHRNDLFINGLGLLTSIGGAKLRWWIDPMGATILSTLIIVLWLTTAYKEFMHLIGITADTEFQQLITYVSMTHSPMITHIDTVRAYHSGPRLIVEVDVVMDASETLRATHDVAEELQIKLESLPDVERAYVHVDYETSHKPVSLNLFEM
jgi:cation diffusion facilitator family transporter